eukprot:COSAG05_NODE_147_length_16383_cov_266.102555_21_plen_59_part_00
MPRYQGWAHLEMEKREALGATYFESAYALRYGVAIDPTLYACESLSELLQSPLLEGTI